MDSNRFLAQHWSFTQLFVNCYFVFSLRIPLTHHRSVHRHATTPPDRSIQPIWKTGGNGSLVWLPRNRMAFSFFTTEIFDPAEIIFFRPKMLLRDSEILRVQLLPRDVVC